MTSEKLFLRTFCVLKAYSLRCLRRWKVQLQRNVLRLTIKKTNCIELGPQTDASMDLMDRHGNFQIPGELHSGGGAQKDVDKRVNRAWQKWQEFSEIICGAKVRDH